MHFSEATTGYVRCRFASRSAADTAALQMRDYLNSSEGLFAPKGAEAVVVWSGAGPADPSLYLNPRALDLARGLGIELPVTESIADWQLPPGLIRG